MPEARIGRVIVASLHQAIADVLPQRLEFYENWLDSDGLREGTLGLAPMMAVLSFLRAEGGAYADVVARAGEYAADWSVSAMPPWKRRFVLMMPGAIRSRMALGLARRLVRESYAGSKANGRVRRGKALVDLQGSVFCSVRGTAAQALCGFYAALVERMLKLFQVQAEAQPSQCRALGDASCEITAALGARQLPS